MKLGFQETKLSDVQIMPPPTNGWWCTVVTINQFTTELESASACLRGHELFPWRPLFIAPLMNINKKWKVRFLNNYLRLRRIDQSGNRWLGTHWQIRPPSIYLKQAFQENSKSRFERGEPLTIITGGHNHKDHLTYALKTLLQNAPHDSILWCSVDDVHREMEVRFAKVNQVGGNFVKTNLLNEWKGKLATQKPRVSTSLYGHHYWLLHNEVDTGQHDCRCSRSFVRLAKFVIRQKALQENGRLTCQTTT